MMGINNDILIVHEFTLVTKLKIYFKKIINFFFIEFFSNYFKY